MATAAAAFALAATATATTASAGAVTMAMRDFLFGGIAFFNEIDSEKQVLPGERVIRVERNLIAIDLYHLHDWRLPIRSCLEIVPYLHLVDRKLSKRHHLDLRLVPKTIAFLRANEDLVLLAGLHFLQAFLEAFDDVARASEKLERLPLA